MEKDLTIMEGFRNLSREERLERVRAFCNLSTKDIDVLGGKIPMDPNIAEHLIENVVGYFPMPMGVATYFNIDGKDIFVPMAVEETSIIAAASATAKWIRREGTIRTYSRGRLIIGQIQIPGVKDVARAKEVLHQSRHVLMALSNACVPGLVRRGGGIQDIAIRELRAPEDAVGPKRSTLVLHLLCDPCDAMGANLINQVCEAVKPKIEELTDEKVGLCILSNLVDSKIAGAEVILRNVSKKVGRGIQDACEFAKQDPYRAATHNKGVLNGIDAVLIATGNDWRAVESGAHAYAARSGKYQPITDWKMEGSDLIGRIEIPLAVGTVGGVTRVHPVAQVALKILDVKHAEELARICAAVGLVQNLGALKALSTVGIVKGHMQLHAANLAIAAGADVHEIQKVREHLVECLKKEKTISLSLAKEVLASIRVRNLKEVQESAYL